MLSSSTPWCAIHPRKTRRMGFPLQKCLRLSRPFILLRFDAISVNVNSYDPRASRQAEKKGAETYLISPLTGERIPASQYAEHMRISLLVPDQAARKAKYVDISFCDSSFVHCFVVFMVYFLPARSNLLAALSFVERNCDTFPRSCIFRVTRISGSTRRSATQPLLGNLVRLS